MTFDQFFYVYVKYDYKANTSNTSYKNYTYQQRTSGILENGKICKIRVDGTKKFTKTTIIETTKSKGQGKGVQF